MQGQESTHGAPLGVEDVKHVKKTLVHYTSYNNTVIR